MTFRALSVCIPTYKSIEVVKPTLDCLMAQTHKDFEIVIGNDSPADHEALRKLLDSYRAPP